MAVFDWLKSFVAAKCLTGTITSALIFGFIVYTVDVSNFQAPFRRLGGYVADRHAQNNIAPPQPLPVQRPVSGKQHDKTEEEQSRRKELLEEYCQRNVSSDMLPRRVPVGNFFVSDRYKVLYCKVGKTGSTTTSTLLYNLEFGTNFSQRGFWEHHAAHATPLRRLSSYTEEEKNLRLNTYKKFLVARNPLERLVSAYLFFFGGKDYFVGTGRQVRYNKLYQNMLETIGWNASTAKIPHTEDYGVIQDKSETYPVIPFLAFVRAVTEDTNKWDNEHWAVVSDYCPPCKVHFDFIAHTETLVTDLNAFFRNVTEREEVFPRNKARRGKTKILDLYRQIPISDIQRIERKFKSDFDMFGYSFQETILQLLST